MRTVRLRPSVEPFPASTGDIYLLRSDGGGDVVLREASPFARELVDALAEGVRPAERPELQAALAELEEAGVVAQGSLDPAAEGLSPAEALRYDRQLHYFGDQAVGRRERHGHAARAAQRERGGPGRRRARLVDHGGTRMRGRRAASWSWTTTRSSSATSTGRCSTGCPTSAGPRSRWPRSRCAR